MGDLVADGVRKLRVDAGEPRRREPSALGAPPAIRGVLVEIPIPGLSGPGIEGGLENRALEFGTRVAFRAALRPLSRSVFRQARTGSPAGGRRGPESRRIEGECQIVGNVGNHRQRETGTGLADTPVVQPKRTCWGRPCTAEWAGVRHGGEEDATLVGQIRGDQEVPSAVKLWENRGSGWARRGTESTVAVPPWKPTTVRTSWASVFSGRLETGGDPIRSYLDRPGPLPATVSAPASLPVASFPSSGAWSATDSRLAWRNADPTPTCSATLTALTPAPRNLQPERLSRAIGRATQQLS